jgi:hypothetical protein
VEARHLFIAVEDREVVGAKIEHQQALGHCIGRRDEIEMASTRDPVSVEAGWPRQYRMTQQALAKGPFQQGSIYKQG